MKVIVLKRFRDKHTGEMHDTGETLTISKERYSEILSVGEFVQKVDTKKKEPDEEPEE